jgi:hypothetical protein
VPPPPPGDGITVLEGPGQPAAAKPSSKGKIIAAVVAAVVLIAGAIVTVVLVSNRTSSTGAANPEEAVEKMLGSLEDNDLLGVLDMLAPWERDFARGLVDDYIDNAKDAGYVADDADLSDVGGYTLEVDDLRVSTTEVNDRIVNVALVGGTARFATQFDQLPLGAEALKQLAEATGGDTPEDLDATGDLAELGLPPVTTIEDDGRWYVSLFYTVAETARLAADAPPPSSESAIPAVGAGSPEEASDEFISALERLDVRRLIELTPPDEMGVLHDYAPLFIDQLGEPLEGGSIDIRDTEYRVEDVDGGRKVIPTRFVVEVTGESGPTTVTYERTDDRVSLVADVDGEVTEVALEERDAGTGFSLSSTDVNLTGSIVKGDAETLNIDFEGTAEGEEVSATLTATPDADCILLSGDVTSGGETEPVAEQLCPDDFGDEGLELSGAPVALEDVFDQIGDFVEFDRFSQLFDLGLVAVEVDGDWYISPLRSTTELFGAFAALAEGS